MEMIDQPNIFRYHQLLINESGEGSKTALGWNDPSSQEGRYKIIMVKIIQSRCIIDVSLSGYYHWQVIVPNSPSRPRL